jgi:Protein of unknown function (DUF2950)
MGHHQMKYKITCWLRAGALLALAAGLAGSVSAQQDVQRTFPTPSDAANALMNAVKNNDEQDLRQILGSDSPSLIATGDETEDRESRENFVRKYEEMHRLVKHEETGQTVLYVGAENWPMPVPLVKRDGAWIFDTNTGKREVLYRRIGENELDAIEACHELVDAQREYYQSASTGSVKHFAQEFTSYDGSHGALYWGSSGPGPSSPIGPLLANAGITASDRQPSPFHGYYFRLLTRQGKNARGGAKSYLTAGKMTRGFAVVAFPAEYKSSGVMTFIVSQDGTIYEKDLGPSTGEIARAMEEYNPDASWHRAE